MRYHRKRSRTMRLRDLTRWFMRNLKESHVSLLCRAS